MRVLIIEDSRELAGLIGDALKRAGIDVDIVGLNVASETIVDRLAIHDKPGALERLMGH